MENKQICTYLQNADSLNHETLEDLKAVTEEFPWFQAGWLLYLKNLKVIGSPDYDAVLKKVALMVPERKHLSRFLNSELSKRRLSLESMEDVTMFYRLEDGVESAGGNALIDKFLRTDLSTERVIENNVNSSESGDSNEILRKSVAENDEIITETLASIYFQQKNYEKAQQAYQKLSLKYPEKSVYFAARIKEIEVLKKNN